MRKLLFAFAVVAMICACSGERQYLSYRNLPMNMSAKAMCDSLLQRGLVFDSTLTDSGRTYVLQNAEEHYRLDIVYNNDTISDVLEQYAASYNDSTSELWQQMRDKMAAEITTPFLTHRADLHKEAVFQTDKGTITLTLLNTYTPTLTVRYSNEVIVK